MPAIVGSVARQAAAAAVDHAAASPALSAVGAALDSAEQAHWRRLAALKGTATARPLIAQVATFVTSRELRQEYTVAVPRYALPDDHPQSALGLMRRAAALAASGELEAAVAMLNVMAEREADDLRDPSDAVPLPEYSVLAVLYAWYLDVALPAGVVSIADDNGAATGGSGSGDGPAEAADAGGPDASSSRGDASGAGDSAVSSSSGSGSSGGNNASSSSSGYDPLQLARYHLELRTKNAPKDSLAPVAALVAQVLGLKHPIAQVCDVSELFLTQ